MQFLNKKVPVWALLLMLGAGLFFLQEKKEDMPTPPLSTSLYQPEQVPDREVSVSRPPAKSRPSAPKEEVAMPLARKSPEPAQVATQPSAARSLSAHELKSQKRYREAIDAYRDLIEVNGGDDHVYRELSICYEETGNKKEAYGYLKKVRDRSDTDNARLKSLNPERKQIIGYCTLCRDGTYSPSCATGRGACSHHGGVREWNAPVYAK